MYTTRAIVADEDYLVEEMLHIIISSAGVVDLFVVELLPSLVGVPTYSVILRLLIEIYCCTSLPCLAAGRYHGAGG